MNQEQTIQDLLKQAQAAQQSLNQYYKSQGSTLEFDVKTGKQLKPAQPLTTPNLSPITPSDLTPTKPVSVPNVQSNTASMALASSLPSIQEPVQQQTAPSTREQIQQQILELINKQGTQGEVAADIYKQEGVSEKQKLAQDLTKQYEQKQQAYTKKIEQIRENKAGLFGGAVEQEVANVERQMNSELADIAIQQKAAVGDYTGAMEIADKKIAAEFEPLDNQIKGLQLVYSFLQDDLTESEKLQAQAVIQEKQALMEFGMQKELYAYKASLDAQQVGDGYGLSSKQQTLLNGVINNYSKDSTVQQAQSAQQIFNIVSQLKANPNTPGNQLIALYTLVKNLDPDSAVREGEVQLASMTNSYLGKFQDSLARISEGRVLNPNAVRELATATENLAQEWVKSGQRRQTQYMSQANVFGLSEPFSTYLSGFQNPNMITGAQVTPQQSEEQAFDSVISQPSAKWSNFWSSLKGLFQ